VTYSIGERETDNVSPEEQSPKGSADEYWEQAKAHIDEEETGGENGDKPKSRLAA
jgi:hypothetical protein